MSYNNEENHPLILAQRELRRGKGEKEMKAAIYCRVSTDNQEREGTSLQTQLENCLTYCRDKGCDVAYRFSETYSGLSLERPELDKLRELVRTEAIDVVVCYSLDRLTRDPGHGVIITQELEKHSVKLEAVTENVDNTELGKLISYIRGFAAKLEAEKIRERSIRGKRARAREGRIPSGGGTTLYGYDYIKVSQENGGRRIINEKEAYWVCQMYSWLVNESLSTYSVMYRLRAMNAPSKSGNVWNRRSVQAVLTNPSYIGKTYVFTTSGHHKQFTRPQSEWIEIKGATPAIINPELYEAAQKQLQANRKKTVTTTKYEYLLRGHIRCRQCGRAYASSVSISMQSGKRYVKRYYYCTGKLRSYAPIERCSNKGWSANKLEPLVWNELEHYLSNRDLIASELEKQSRDADHLGVFESQLKDIERQLKAIDHEQHQLLQWALKGFPESQVEAENQRLNKARETLKARKVELEAQLTISQQAVINVPNLEHFIENVQKRLHELGFESKRLALDMLGITVYIDGNNVEVIGIIEPENQSLRWTSNQRSAPIA